MYQCPECGYTDVDPGECPTCKVPLVEVEDEENNGYDTHDYEARDEDA